MILSKTDTILKEIQDGGFSVAQLKEVLLSRQVAEELYNEQREKPFFNQLLEFMCRFVCLSTELPRPAQVFLATTFLDNLGDSESSQSQFHCLHSDRCAARDFFHSG